jgi:hypothetical protein
MVYKTQNYLICFRPQVMSGRNLRKRTDLVSETLRSFVFLEYQTMDKAQKLSTIEHEERV